MQARTATKIAAAALILAASGAHASGLDLTLHAEAGAGLTKYSVVPDGIWYQLGMPHAINRSGAAFQIGVTGDIANADIAGAHIGIAYHADYVSLARAAVSCDCTTLDADYSTSVHQLIVPLSRAPIAHYAGTGSIQGTKLVLSPYFDAGHYRISYEFGVLAYRPDWRETVYDWSYSVGPGPRSTGSRTANASFQFAHVYGVSVTRGPLTLSYEHFPTPMRDIDAYVPLFYTAANVLMITYQF